LRGELLRRARSLSVSCATAAPIVYEKYRTQRLDQGLPDDPRGSRPMRVASATVAMARAAS
jgi:hypothetical protein